MTNLSSETEISYLDGAIRFQEILWLEISMKVAMLMHISQSLQSLVDNVSNVDFVKGSLAVFHQLKHVLLHELKHKVEFIILFHDLKQANDVWVTEFDE